MTTLTDTYRTMGASKAAQELIDVTTLEWHKASSSREDGRLSVADVRGFIERCEADPDASNSESATVDFDPANGLTWIDRDLGVTPDTIVDADKSASQGAEAFGRGEARLDHIMLAMARVYAHRMDIKSGTEPGSSKLDAFNAGMKAALPRALAKKAFASYVSNCKAMLARGIIPGETVVHVPATRYTKKEGSTGSNKALEMADITIDSIGQWKGDFWAERDGGRAGLRVPAIRKNYGPSPTARKDATKWASGEKQEPAAQNDAGSELAQGLNLDKDFPLLKEAADELRRAQKAGCLVACREILSDALAAMERAIEDKVRDAA